MERITERLIEQKDHTGQPQGVALMKDNTGQPQGVALMKDNTGQPQGVALTEDNIQAQGCVPYVRSNV